MDLSTAFSFGFLTGSILTAALVAAVHFIASRIERNTRK